MKRSFRRLGVLCLLATIMPLGLIFGGARPVAVVANQTDRGARGSAFVSGSWRVQVVGAAQAQEVAAAGLVSNGESDWLVIVADVMNVSEDDSELPVSDFSVKMNGESGAAGTATISTDLNLRAAPSLDAEVLAVMPMGSTVTITGAEENGFLPVQYSDVAGWAATEGLVLDGETPGASGGAISLASEAIYACLPGACRCRADARPGRRSTSAG